MRKTNWSTYAFEFLSIFVAVVSAFALSNWNDNRKDALAEAKILEEVSRGLEKDIEDIEINIMGHEIGLAASQYWRKVIRGQTVGVDSIQFYYFNFLRDFISIQNTSGYETLKSRGLELVEDDSLRTAIVSLYEYDYQVLEKFEEEYAEMQFHQSYHNEMSRYLAPNFQYDAKGSIVGLDQPLQLNEKDQNRLLSYLWKIEANRRFLLSYYSNIKKNIEALKKRIDQ